MNTIFIITIIFIVIYNTWYDSYISQLFLLASKDTEKNSHCCILLNSLMLKKITCLSTRPYATFLPFEKNHNWDHAHSSVLKAVDKFLIGG